MTINIKSIIKTTLVFSFCFCAAGLLLAYEHSAGHISVNVFVNAILVLFVTGGVALAICFKRLRKTMLEARVSIEPAPKSGAAENLTLLKRVLRLYPAVAFIALIPIACYMVVKLELPKVILLIAIPCYVLLAVGFYQLFNKRSEPK